MKRPLAAALALAAVGLVAAYASAASQTGRLLGGRVQVVAYADGQVRICPDYAIAAAFGPGAPPDCRTGLPAAGVQVDALPNQASNPDERWGFLYLQGTYANGTFQVTSQSGQAPAGSPGDGRAKPPCRPPHGGWRLIGPTESQRHSLARYQRRHNRVRSRVVKLLVVRPQSRYGWVSGAGGDGVTPHGQPTVSLDVLIETAQLRTFLSRQPRGLVVVDPTLHPVAD